MLPNGFTVLSVSQYLRRMEGEISAMEGLTLEQYLGTEWLATLQAAI
jgi:hypothetical protein